MLRTLAILLMAHSSLYAVDTTVFTSPSGDQEVCEVPTDGVFSKKDKKDMKKLCKMDFYGLTPDKKLYAICPKLKPTNPAVNLYKLDDKTLEAKEKAEAALCSDLSLKAKFKQSITCSYYPSILGYYHMNQFLKGPEVPETVYRTMDKDEHNKISKIAIKNTSGLINKLWKQFDSWETSEEIVGKKALLFNKDLTQIAGALSKNPKGEEKYYEVMGLKDTKGKRCGYDGRAQCFKDNPITGYAALSHPRAVSLENYPLSFQKGAKLIQKLKDISEMLIMDHIMSQADRFGNQHYYENFFYETEDGSFGKVKVKKYTNNETEKVLVSNDDPDKKIAYSRVTIIPVMIMKDNDCGITKRNLIREYHLVKGIKHLHYDFYKRLMEFSKFYDSEEGKEFFKTNTHFRERDYQKVLGNIKEVVSILKNNCEAGNIKFDLSHKHFFNKTEKQNPSCL